MRDSTSKSNAADLFFFPPTHVAEFPEHSMWPRNATKLEKAEDGRLD